MLKFDLKQSRALHGLATSYYFIIWNNNQQQSVEECKVKA